MLIWKIIVLLEMPKNVYTHTRTRLARRTSIEEEKSFPFRFEKKNNKKEVRLIVRKAQEDRKRTENSSVRSKDVFHVCTKSFETFIQISNLIAEKDRQITFEVPLTKEFFSSILSLFSENRTTDSSIEISRCLRFTLRFHKIRNNWMCEVKQTVNLFLAHFQVHLFILIIYNYKSF